MPGIEETETSFRVRQRNPGDFQPGSFRTMKITEGIRAVVGHYKRNYKALRYRSVAKAEGERRVIYYAVAVPDEQDAHGEYLDAATIQDAAWRNPWAPIRLEHGRPGAMARWQASGICDASGYVVGCQVVESYILPCTIEAGGTFHGENQAKAIPEGTHIIGVMFPEAIWQEVRDTDHGISYGGYAADEERI